MSTGYSWEGTRQVRTMLFGACHVPEHLCGGRVNLGRYIKCSIFTFFNTPRVIFNAFVDLEAVLIKSL